MKKLLAAASAAVAALALFPATAQAYYSDHATAQCKFSANWPLDSTINYSNPSVDSNNNLRADVTYASFSSPGKLSSVELWANPVTGSTYVLTTSTWTYSGGRYRYRIDVGRRLEVNNSDMGGTTANNGTRCFDFYS